MYSRKINHLSAIFNQIYKSQFFQNIFVLSIQFLRRVSNRSNRILTIHLQLLNTIFGKMSLRLDRFSVKGLAMALAGSGYSSRVSVTWQYKAYVLGLTRFKTGVEISRSFVENLNQHSINRISLSGI